MDLAQSGIFADLVLLQVLHRERWDDPMAASLARNIVRDHADKDVEMLYKTIRDMKAVEELHKKAMKHKMGGDNIFLHGHAKY